MNFPTPTGFRDIMPEEARQREDLNMRIQTLFDGRGYVPIETPTLEIMDVLEQGGRIPAVPFKLFDAAGDLLAMRPDVTLQIARMCATRLREHPGPLKFRYTQRVFREAEAEAASREMTQVGVEAIGCDGPEADAELVGLMMEALHLCGIEDFKMSLGTVSVLRALLAECGAPEAWKDQVLHAYHASDYVNLRELTAADGIDPRFAKALAELPRIRGGRTAIAAARALVEPLGCDAGLKGFEETFDCLERAGLLGSLSVDFAIVSSFDYYTGIVFEASVPALGTPLGSGGRYDTTLAAFGQQRPAAGFAFYLEQVMAALARTGDPADRPLRIAVPKGSLNEGTIAILAAAGLDTTGLDDPGRHLIINNPGVEYIIVRPTDAPVFVALGAADCGICGKDSLLEADPDIVELVDLGYGGCRFVVAEPRDTAASVEERYRKLGAIRVATKYPRITKSYYDGIGMQVEIVKLHGNIELAPLTGMAERIVDITATGTTLKENDLVVVDEVLSSTARFFANPCAFRTDARIADLAVRLQRQVEK